MKVPQKTNKFLLFDDQYTAEKNGFKTSVNQAEITEAPALAADHTWERGGLSGDSCVTVLKEDGVYKMWYCIGNPESEGRENRVLSARERGNLDLLNVPQKFIADILCPSRYFLCYATSKDGLNWEKKSLGLYELDGNRENNIVFSGRIGATVFIDPTAEPDKKYKMIHGGSLRLPHWMKQKNEFVRMAYTGIYGAYSPDGIHWTGTEKQIMPWYTDTTNVCYWDDAIKKYVAYVRIDKDMTFENGKTLMVGPGHNTYRIIARSESEDFENFPPPTSVLEPEPDEVEDYYKGDTCNNGLDFYNSSALKYPFAENCYFMFPSYFYHAPDTLDLHISTSRNGIDYTRHDQPVLPIGKFGDFDARQLYMGTGMIKEKRRIYMYCLAYDTGHGSNIRKAAVGRIAFREDGFVSQDAADNGTYTTVPIRIGGDCNCLKVNLETVGEGFMRCALLRPSGEVIAGKSVEDSDIITGDHLEVTMSWKGVSDLKSLQGQDIKIKFVGKSVKLYSFHLAPESN
jgi:hypothetical protein